MICLFNTCLLLFLFNIIMQILHNPRYNFYCINKHSYAFCMFSGFIWHFHLLKPERIYCVTLIESKERLSHGVKGVGGINSLIKFVIRSVKGEPLISQLCLVLSCISIVMYCVHRIYLALQSLNFNILHILHDNFNHCIKLHRGETYFCVNSLLFILIFKYLKNMRAEQNTVKFNSCLSIGLKFLFRDMLESSAVDMFPDSIISRSQNLCLMLLCNTHSI